MKKVSKQRVNGVAERMRVRLRARFFVLAFVHTLGYTRRIMKTDIHPVYFPEAKITCACGHVITVGSTKASMEVEVCSNCHPFYTGKGKLIDTTGRVEKFKARVAKAAATVKPAKKPRAKKTPEST